MIWSLLPSPISSRILASFTLYNPVTMTEFISVPRRSHIFSFINMLSLFLCQEYVSPLCLMSMTGMREGMSAFTIIFLSLKTGLGTKLARGIRLHRNIQIYQLHCSRYLLTLEGFWLAVLLRFICLFVLRQSDEILNVKVFEKEQVHNLPQWCSEGSVFWWKATIIFFRIPANRQGLLTVHEPLSQWEQWARLELQPWAIIANFSFKYKWSIYAIYA